MTSAAWTRTAVSALAACAVLSSEASAQSAPPSTGPWDSNAWRFAASIYIYGPKIGGNLAFPSRSGNGELVVDPSNIFDSLNGAFMGAFEANNGKWGLFTDYMYLDVSGSSSGTRDFSIGGINRSSTLTADLDLKVKGSVWTIAGEYRLPSSREWTVDVLLGARQLDVKPRLNWGLSGDLANIPIASRGGSIEIKANNWDAIVGVKGRYAFGDRQQWYVPLYADVGGGDSRLTYQLAGGIAYSFGSIDVVGLWRYLRYDMKSNQPVQDLSFNGPMLGATFRW